jgi:hypothetical protein
MTISNPFRRISRPFINDYYFPDMESMYFLDPRNAKDGIDLIRGYHLLEKELYKIFEYVEPADANLDCYSHQFYALLLRASTEFEANSRAILNANGYAQRNLNITDYYKINFASKLSEYSVIIPVWHGNSKKFMPLKDWDTGHCLSWYQNYNNAKHNRSANFSHASIKNAIYAVGSVFCILFSQFNILTFDPNHPIHSFSIGDNDNLWSHDACLLAIEPPSSWQLNEKYDFDWSEIKHTKDPFQNYAF